MHLSDGKHSACLAWRCGTKEEQSKTAEWASGASRWSSVHAVHFCTQCYSVRVVTKLGGSLTVDGEDVAVSDSSGSESGLASDSDAEE